MLCSTSYNQPLSLVPDFIRLRRGVTLHVRAFDYICVADALSVSTLLTP